MLNVLKLVPFGSVPEGFNNVYFCFRRIWVMLTAMALSISSQDGGIGIELSVVPDSKL